MHKASRRPEPGAPLPPRSYLYKEGMKLAARYKAEEDALRAELKVGRGGERCALVWMSKHAYCLLCLVRLCADPSMFVAAKECRHVAVNSPPLHRHLDSPSFSLPSSLATAAGVR